MINEPGAVAKLLIFTIAKEKFNIPIEC